MSDSKRRFQAVRDALRNLFPGDAQGNVARHLNTLAALVSGIVAGQSTCLPHIAQKVPGVKPESRVKQLSRWLKNEDVVSDIYFLPFAKALLSALSHLPLVLVIDGSIVGRGCMTLMVGLVYRKRALPIAWLVAKRRKGHFPEDMHIELIRRVHELVPEGARVVLLGDGEFDGVNLQALISKWEWEYALRTSKTTTLTWEGEEFIFDDVTDNLQPGDYFHVPNASFTRRHYGPVQAITWWRKDCKEPIHLVTNIGSPEEAIEFYTKRFRIETFFSDQKSRGFNLHKSRLSKPERLSRLMMAACLAYYWIIYLGAYAIESGLDKIIHRNNRCDLSLFQLGLRLLDHLLKEELPLPVAFRP